ncbi:hypothetical protein ABIE41_002130 [Bosea sp. OAE506]|uniref:AlbA family DNA-binding domain-containing protein n=1 Tax=Bosea sp. OAE506 TaxID=2663870 RepID=UPI00178A5CC2
MTEIRTKPLDAITWDDIVALAASGVAEDAMFEFKGLLPEKNGKDHPWYGGRDLITDSTRDELAAEVVALANAYGGRLIIGIAETQDRPRKAASLAPLPRCERFAEQFEQALRSIVDPPIGGFQIKTILDPETENTGAVIIAVPASDLAPHGIGRPPAAYVRRGTSCEAMTMRDLQSVFWDARTRQQRVREIRAEHSQEMASWPERKLSLGLIDSNGSAVHPQTRGLFLRVSAIPQQAFSISPFPFDHLRQSLRPSLSRIAPNASAPFGDGSFGSGWTRTAHGAWYTARGPGRWAVRDDGTLSLIGFKPGMPGANPDAPVNFHHPGWYAALCGQMMIAADRLRRDAGRPDVPIELDVEFIADGEVTGGNTSAYAWGGDTSGKMLPKIEIGPILLTSRASFDESYRRLESEVWHAFGLTEFASSTINFEAAFAGYRPAS